MTILSLLRSLSVIISFASLLFISNLKYGNADSIEISHNCTVLLNNTDFKDIESHDKPIKDFINNPEIYKYKYKQYLQFKKDKDMCNLFKVFFERQSLINYDDPLFIEIFGRLYHNKTMTNVDIELFYIKNKCYSEIYESKLILTQKNISDMILTIIFLYGIFRYPFNTIIFFIVLNVLQY